MNHREFYLGKNQKYLDTIRTQARIHGKREPLIAAIIDAEIGGGQGPNIEWDAAIRSGVKGSSAVGLGQMTEGTWKGLVQHPGEIRRIGNEKGNVDPHNKITDEKAFLKMREDGHTNIAGIADLLDQNETALIAKMLRRNQHFDQLPLRDQDDLYMRSHMMGSDMALATRFPETYKHRRHQDMAEQALIAQFGGALGKNPTAHQRAARAAALPQAQKWYAANGNDWVSALDGWYQKEGDGSRFNPDKFLQLTPRGLDEGAGGDASPQQVPSSTGNPEEVYAPWGGDKERD